MADDSEQLKGEKTTRAILEVLDEMDGHFEQLDRRTCLEGQQDTQRIREWIDHYGGIAEALRGEIQELPDFHLYDLSKIALITRSFSLYEACWKEAKRRGMLEGKCETT